MERREVKVEEMPRERDPAAIKRDIHREPVPMEELIPSLTILRNQLKLEIETGMLQVSMEPRGLVISLRQAAFFPPGQDTIDSGTYSTIEKLAKVILAVPNKVRLSGHTESRPDPQRPISLQLGIVGRPGSDYARITDRPV